LAFCKSKEKQNAKDLACAKPKSSCIFRCYVSYAGRWQQAKNITLKNEPNNKKHNINSDFCVYFLQPKEI
jgi:hypothetical protein